MKKYIKSNTGTPYDFLSEVENRIAELSGGSDNIDSAQDIMASKWDEQYIPEDVYDDDEQWFQEHVTRFVDVYNYIMTNIPYYKEHFGVKLEDDSDEFYVMLKDGNAPTVIGAGTMQKMAKENWTYDEIDDFISGRLAKVKDKFDRFGAGLAK